MPLVTFKPQAPVEVEAEDVRERGIPRHGRTGQPKIFPEEGGKGSYYSRTTSWIDVLEDHSMLTAWKQRMVLAGVAKEPKLMEQYHRIADPEGDDRRQVDALVAQALDVADTGFRADMGTMLHELTEAIDRGEKLPAVPPEIERDLEAYKKATADIDFVAIEQFGVLDEYQVAGTFDRVGFLPEKLRGFDTGDNDLYTVDLKTSRTLEYGFGKMALQVAAYREMKGYDPETYARSERVFRGKSLNENWGLIIHLPFGEGRCELVPVPLTDGRRGLELVPQVREWRKFWSRKANKPVPIRSVQM